MWRFWDRDTVVRVRIGAGISPSLMARIDKEVRDGFGKGQGASA